jgi:nitrogen fixation/metabolism regulation signal transduction histidine kinase
MVLIEIPLAPEVLAAKDKLSRAETVYNSLALIKEEVVRGKIIWTVCSVTIFLLAGIAVFTARAMSRQISGPIEQLSSAMAKAATGDLTFQADIKARDEIALLVDAFNKMIRDLRESREKLVASERLAAWREVARQVSHEIKNPLTPIHLALHRLRSRFEKIGGEAQVAKESFQSIDEELAALGRLAEAFSSFARLPEPKQEPADLNELIRSTARVYENTPERLKLDLDLQENLPAKMLDRDQMRRVLTNLLKNAAEATPQSSVCEVTLRTRAVANGRIELEVIDNGAGLSAEALKKIFQPNFTTKQEGAGLGLAMVKRIIEQHGGSIEVESVEGKGTAFKIIFA